MYIYIYLYKYDASCVQFVNISVPAYLNKNSIFFQATFITPPMQSSWMPVQVTFFIYEDVFTKKTPLINSFVAMYFHDYFPRKYFWRLFGSKGGREKKTMCTIGLCSKESLLGVHRRHSSFGHSPLCPTHVLGTLPCLPSSQLGQCSSVGKRSP